MPRIRIPKLGHCQPNLLFTILNCLKKNNNKKTLLFRTPPRSFVWFFFNQNWIRSSSDDAYKKLWNWNWLVKLFSNDTQMNSTAGMPKWTWRYICFRTFRPNLLYIGTPSLIYLQSTCTVSEQRHSVFTRYEKSTFLHITSKQFIIKSWPS